MHGKHRCRCITLKLESFIMKLSQLRSRRSFVGLRHMPSRPVVNILRYVFYLGITKELSFTFVIYKTISAGVISLI